MHKNKYMLYQHWARYLISFYPTDWRERYGEEMLMILEDAQPTLKTLLNLLLNLGDAYFHQNLITGRTPHMLQRMRSNELTIYGSTLIFFVAWFLVQLHFVDTGSRVLFHSFSHNSSLFTNIVSAVSCLLPLLILLGGLPILLAACWQALRKREFLSLLFCLLSLISPIAVLVIALSRPYTWFFTPFGILLGLVISLAFITYAVQKLTPSRRVTQYALLLATLNPLVMVIGLVALLLRIFPTLATLLMAGDSLLYIIRDDLLVFIMIGTLLLSLLALKKGFQARSTLAALAEKDLQAGQAMQNSQ
ncbi:hypothetical protein KDA_54270 [Dictyobacter alpinus]|uniref:Uncharacterized protein n=1 Tax=Dictyobacter alpinus TaxID=2014873 RepID=A0A402BEY6_9CHLR|nr:hypothetical protein [Dictyobacter alpinus]GCE29943.1 hypothetical protein KDA_54270 [Dictyobacter alpinus]